MLRGWSSTCCEQASWLTTAESIRIQAPQQVSGGLKELHAPCIMQLALLLTFKALRTFSAALGAGETEALGAATATVLESARMNASKGIVSPRIFFKRSESLWDLAAEAGSGLAQSWFWLNVDKWRLRQDPCLYTLKENVYFHKNFGLRNNVTFYCVCFGEMFR